MFERLKRLFHHPQTSRKEKLISAIVAFGFVVGMGRYGQKAMEGEWFQSLTAPAIQPPGWVFALIWSLLFILVGFAGYKTWNFYESEIGRRIFAGLFLLNGVLLATWSHQFLIRHSMMGGLFVLLALIIVAEAMIITGFRVNRQAAYLLIPYLGWLFFATYLNAAYITINL